MLIEVYFDVSSACSGWIHLNRKDWRAAEEAFIKLIGHPANKKDPYAWLGLGTLNLYSAPTDLRKVCRWSSFNSLKGYDLVFAPLLSIVDMSFSPTDCLSSQPVTRLSESLLLDLHICVDGTLQEGLHERAAKNHKQALEAYRTVLEGNSSNVYAANGIGAVLAEQVGPCFTWQLIWPLDTSHSRVKAWKGSGMKRPIMKHVGCRDVLGCQHCILERQQLMGRMSWPALDCTVDLHFNPDYVFDVKSTDRDTWKRRVRFLYRWQKQLLLQKAGCSCQTRLTILPQSTSRSHIRNRPYSSSHLPCANSIRRGDATCTLLSPTQSPSNSLVTVDAQANRLLCARGMAVAVAFKTFPIDTQGRDAAFLLYLARAHYDANRLPEARAALLRAVHLCPGDHRLRFNLGLTMQVGPLPL